ncbi:MAG: galactokinase [Bacteroidetes bacterium 24-39-8]|jgi:galactokinase|nr:MAG: galactokinase [Sphingobacteriia bacterium 35-40-8]OYZ48908.1 MAG: galactokinase [Bacteroidetes bacterium 24-39-8]OZA65623.1 MAG: galactokinase [Sphingobacteriia bacterium 39-39-8]HQR92774.1 galactokinase [Sediminibacterium sp.]HQS53591.1 galactokinase [Sediminibacterium sp.]
MSEKNKCATLVQTQYTNAFGSPELMVKSPGRINLIGEHTDYNLGFVLPAAIDKAIYIAIGKRTDQNICLHAADLDQSIEMSLDSLEPSPKQWPNYLLGIADQLKKAGYPISGFNAVVAGDVPLGAGLSSSAAVECATVFALNELFVLGMSKLEMVRMAQKAENEFVGLKCGIMDMFASMFGKADAVIQLDCRSLDYHYMPFHQKGFQIVLLDTCVKHSLASTEYNTRRAECEAGVAIIAQQHPQVKSLRDADLGMVESLLAGGDVKVYQRCKFIVAEIARLQAGCQDLVNDNIDAFGLKMFETHIGLSKEYEVSCVELDFLADFAKDQNGVIGARMMGGGFGGCTINLVKDASVDTFITGAATAFKNRFQQDLKSYIVAIGDGTSLINF